MASPIWIGGAPAVAQVDKVIIPDDVEAGQTVTFYVGTRDLPVPLTGTTPAEVAAELAAAWNASVIAEFAEVTAAASTDSSDNDIITLTAKVAGKPFAVTVSIGSGNNEKQIIALGGTAATGGTFTLTFNSETTTTIAYNASAATVQAALEGLASYSSGDFTVTGSAGGPWTVEFTGTLAATNVSIMTIDVSSLTGGVNEIQTISCPNSPTGGTFRLKYGGEWTGDIAYNASAATIETALEALSTIPTGSVACAGGALPTDVTVTFQDNLGYTDVALLEVDASSLTGITATPTETTGGGSTLTDNLEAWFSFTNDGTGPYIDDVNGVIEISISGNAGLSTSVRTSTTGVGQRSFFTVSSGYGYYDSTTFMARDSDENFAVSTWFRFGSEYNPLNIISRSSTSGGEEWRLGTAVGGYAYFKVGSSTVTSAVALTTNVWHHVVAVYDADSGAIKVSVNGAAFESGTYSASAFTAGTTGGQIKIGGNTDTVYIDSTGFYTDVLTISEAQSIYDGGDGVDYPFTGVATNEVQTLTITGSPTSGSVEVSYQGVGVDVPYDATAAEAEALIETISTIGAGNVNVTGGDWPGTALVVEFINDLGLGDRELLELDVSKLVMQTAETTKGKSAPTGTVTTSVTPLEQSTTTSNSGPNNWDVAANWSTNTVPVASDTVYFSDSDVDVLYGLDQSAVTLAELHIEQTYTGTIGLPRINSDTANSTYYEYREQYLKIGATELFIGEKDGDGSERIKINLGSVQTTALITNSGDSPDGNTPPILLLGTHASNVINVNRGFVGIAYFPAETATVATIRQAFIDDAVNDTEVYVGAGATLTTIKKTGGTLDINSATTSFEQTAGTTNVHDGAHTVLNVLAGTLNYNSTGTLSAVNLSGDAVLVFDQDARLKDVTIINKYSDDSEIYDESGSIASPVINMPNIGDMSNIHMGKDFTLTFSAST